MTSEVYISYYLFEISPKIMKIVWNVYIYFSWSVKLREWSEKDCLTEFKILLEKQLIHFPTSLECVRHVSTRWNLAAELNAPPCYDLVSCTSISISLCFEFLLCFGVACILICWCRVCAVLFRSIAIETCSVGLRRCGAAALQRQVHRWHCRCPLRML